MKGVPHCPVKGCTGNVFAIYRSGGEFYCDECGREFYGDTRTKAIEEWKQRTGR